jgi:hypothetical protein
MSKYCRKEITADSSPLCEINLETNTALLSTVHPKIVHEGPEEERYSSNLSLTYVLYGVGGQRHALFALPQGAKPIVQEAWWAPGPAWKGAETSPPPGLDPWIVQPVASFYSDYVIPAHALLSSFL